jgi:3'-5' exoribonuclease
VVTFSRRLISGDHVKAKYIESLVHGDELTNETFLLQDVVRRVTKDGRPYLLCTLSDRTGQTSGVFWDVPPAVEAWIRSGLVIYLSGRAGNYRDTLQINLSDANPCDNPDMTHFLPASKRPRQEMVAELEEVIAQLSQPWQGLVGHLLLEPSFLIHFSNAPAARMMHHAYVGGLLEHTLSMVRLAYHLAGHYPYVNKDLLIAGTLLHDLGKAAEYTTDASFNFSDDGRLVGHIMRAVIMIEHAAARLGSVDEDDLRQLVHLVASHHGTQEWGSPVVPKTLEAILLHQLDMLDSRVQGFFDHLRADDSDESWSRKPSYMFNTELRRPAGFANKDREQL